MTLCSVIFWEPLHCPGEIKSVSGGESDEMCYSLHTKGSQQINSHLQSASIPGSFKRLHRALHRYWSLVGKISARNRRAIWRGGTVSWFIHPEGDHQALARKVKGSGHTRSHTNRKQALHRSCIGVCVLWTCGERSCVQRLISLPLLVGTGRNVSSGMMHFLLEAHDRSQSSCCRCCCETKQCIVRRSATMERCSGK